MEYENMRMSELKSLDRARSTEGRDVRPKS